jgi:radical SAM superfamily enzyme YgiQ (UPF0313 family)
MSKILLANPPTLEAPGSFNRPVRFPTFNYATPVIHPPLWLAYAASYLRSKGHDVTMLDAQAEATPLNEFLTIVRMQSPDYVVFETSTPSFSSDVDVAAMIKELVDCKIVFLGAHVSALPQDSLENTAVDAVVVGEYELSLGEYIENGAKEIPGICCKDGGGQVVSNDPRPYISDLDELPFPARDLMPNYSYRDPILKNPFTFVLAGRGCPFRCTFCNWPQVLTGRRYRLRSAVNIVDELEQLERQYAFRSFLFNDDTFTVNKEHAIEVCHEMMRRGISLPWGCYSRADNTDMELLTTLKEAGCFLIKVGVESGDEEILSGCNKGYRLDKVKQGVHLMKELGFHVHCTFVFGLPGENKQTIEKTINFAKELSPTTVQFSTAVPYPGTELFEYLKSEGFLKTQDWDSYMPLQPIFEYPQLSSQDMFQAVTRAYRSFFFRPAYVKTGLTKLLAQPKTVISNVRHLIRLAF